MRKDVEDGKDGDTKLYTFGMIFRKSSTKNL